MLKHFIFCFLSIGSIIQCSEIRHVNEDIDRRKILNMLVAGITDTYAKEAWFEKYKVEFENLKTQAHPFTHILPELETKLASCESEKVLCELMMHAANDLEKINTITEKIYVFETKLHGK